MITSNDSHQIGPVMPDISTFVVPDGFLWGASTAAHQTEGNNVASDWWAIEHRPDTFVTEPSGDAVDSFHRWPEDMDLLVGAGFTDYRFSIEWARIEPAEGQFSRANIAHYQAMVDGAIDRGLRPMVTLHHFTNPLWFATRGGWTADGAVELFLRYLDNLGDIIGLGVDRVCTINEPNMIAVFDRIRKDGPSVLSNGFPVPDGTTSTVLIEAHQRATALLRSNHPHLKTGWAIAMQAVEAEPGAEREASEWASRRETVFLEAARHDDWVGVQSYSRNVVGSDGGRPARRDPPPGAKRTQTGWEYYPPAVGVAVRAAFEHSGGTPVIVTENGVATDDDTVRIEYTAGALAALQAAIDDGVVVHGYFHWSLLDNYEWGQFDTTFGLVTVDRATFARSPKPSLFWLGQHRRGEGATGDSRHAAER